MNKNQYYTYHDYEKSADFMRSRLKGYKPELLVILGSGLGDMAALAENATYIPYEEIPNFAVSTAPGHAGRFIAGTINGKSVLMMQGRLHLYEGWTPFEVAYPVRVAKILGINSMIITNASGGVNSSFKAGDVMIIDDFIRLCLENPLIGRNIDEFGERFCDMTYVFDKEYASLFEKVAIARGVTPKHGIYYFASGPMYETPAEIRAIRALGGDAVGMSTVHECIAAAHTGMRILGISVITNMAAGVTDEKLSGDEVIEAGKRISEKLSAIMADFIGKM
ncbi:MAG: purine-nucleoside phosphorylase [Clostridia bacterium]|nr:purine-nucleoside phosphorylase [Clostridia bacterium]